MITITATLLLAWLLMISQAMESMTRAFYARADLDLILASPTAAHKLFAIRISTVALTVAAMALPLAGPFIDMLIWRGGIRWLGAYGVIVAMGTAAAALAVALTVALFRAIGPKRTRLVAQVVAAVIGAAFVIGLQVAAILSYGTLSQASVLQSDGLFALAPGVGERFLVAGARRAWRSRAARRRSDFQFRLARTRRCAGRAALRRIRRRRGRRRECAGESRANAAPFSASLHRGARCAARNGSCCAAIRGWSRRR